MQDDACELWDLMHPLLINVIRIGPICFDQRGDLYSGMGDGGALQNTHFLRVKQHRRECSLIRGGCCYAVRLVPCLYSLFGFLGCVVSETSPMKTAKDHLTAIAPCIADVEA